MRPIRTYFWAPDSKQILYVNDKGGDENFLLYGVDVVTGEERKLTPFEKTRVQVLGVSPLVPGRILVGLNNRDAKWHDVHSLDLATGKLTPVLMNTGDYSGFLADDNLVIRGATKSRADGGSDYYRVVGNKVDAKPTETITLEDSSTTSPAGFTTDGKTLYWVDSRGRNTSALIAQDVATGKKTRHRRGRARRHRRRHGAPAHRPGRGLCGRLSAQRLDADRRRREGRPRTSSRASCKGDISVTSRTAGRRQMDRRVEQRDAAVGRLALRPQGQEPDQAVRQPPGARGHAAHRNAPGRDQVARRQDDGVLPDPAAGHATRTATASRRRPVPMVLLVHGGPWGRDSYGYNGLHQWLANRGYAVLSPNFRASTGFGKKFVNAGNLQWGLKMHDDLIDAVDWAVARGVDPPDKVAIMGGSYGGYATLAGLTFTPDKFACGVDIVGPSNLQTLLEDHPALLGSRQGAVRTSAWATRDTRRAASSSTPPRRSYKADQIKKPLLIGQGANDPRVNVAESEQIVKAMKAKGIPVTYIVFPDEGHGFARPVNSIAFNAAAENFLAGCLGGRAEPVGATLAASSAKVEEGAGLVPGLAAK